MLYSNESIFQLQKFLFVFYERHTFHEKYNCTSFFVRVQTDGNKIYIYILFF